MSNKTDNSHPDIINEISKNEKVDKINEIAKLCKDCLKHKCLCINLFSSDVSTDSAESLDIKETKYLCNTCNSKFKNKITLNLHQKTTNCKPNDKEDKKCCKYCSKVFASKQMKLYHYNNCIEKVKYDIKTEYENKLNTMKEYYESQLKNLDK